MPGAGNGSKRRNKMPDETRVFDVARPGRSSPDATSKPVIVGHHPTMNDPMMKEADSPSPTRIDVQDSGVDGSAIASSGDSTEFSPMSFNTESPTIEETPEPGIIGPEASFGQVFPNQQADIPQAAEHAQTPAGLPAHHEEGLHVGPPKRRKKRLMPAIILILLLLTGAYLAIDSGLIKTGFKMPFHVFKQKAAAPAATTPSPNQNQTATPAVPAGFTVYKLADTDVTFAAPTAWGQPTSTPDPGFSARGGTNKSDGTHAYLVNFAANKDVEIAVTSSKYLPAARTALYYDFLQWCVGTADSKIYLTTLRFSTANKIDTPTTSTCDQGPVADAAKLDAATIVQLKTKGADGKDLGDLYTKNLKETGLPVFRVKDAAMTNGDNIKKLLDTVKVTSATTGSSAQ